MSDAFPKDMTVKQSVLATLAYFELFQVPLTRSELSEQLFFVAPDEQKIDIYLKESPLIQVKEGYFSIQGDVNFYDRFFEQRNRAQGYWKKVRRYQWLFSLCPFVRLVCVANRLPLGVATENSDVDLFVVTAQGRLFLARLCLTLLTQVLGLRRHGKKVKGRFCLSFYVSEEGLDLRPLALEPYDLYLAYWLKTLQPISGDYALYEALMYHHQSWLNRYFKTVRLQKRFYRKAKAWQLHLQKTLEHWLNKDHWEERTKRSQLRRAREKYFLLRDKSGTVLSETMLKFHDDDQRASIREAWMNHLRELL